MSSLTFATASRIVLSSLLAACLLLTCLPGAMSLPQQNTNASNSNSNKKTDTKPLIGKLKEDKTLVRNYAKLLKTAYKNNENNADYIAAQKTYIAAQAKYANYLSQFTEAIRTGKEKQLDQSDDFKKLGTDASQLASDFVKRADELTSHKLGGVPGLGDIVDIAIKVWKAWSDDKQKKRKERADGLDKDLAWDDWADIKV